MCIRDSFRTTPFPDTKIMRDTGPTSNMLQPRTYDWNNAELEDIKKKGDTEASLPCL